MPDIPDGQTIGGLTTKVKADLTDLADAYFPFYDSNLGDDYKMSIEEVRDGISASIVTTADNVYSPTHGLTSGSVGKPIGWKSDGKPYVWDDTASTHEPVAILQSVVDTDNITAKVFGPVAEIAVSLFASTTSGAKYFWDASASLYKTTPQADTVADLKAVYYIGTKDGDANTAICIVLPWVERNGAVADVTDFGAVADSTTDNATAFAAAIATGRPIVYVPGNADGESYLTTDAITFGSSTHGQWLVGDGPSSLIELDDTDSDSNVIEFTGSSTSSRLIGNGIRGVWIKGPGDNHRPSTPPSGGNYGCGVRLYYVNRFTMRDCIVSHCTGNHVWMYGCGNVEIKDNWLIENYNNYVTWTSHFNADIEVYGECEAIAIHRNHCHSNCQIQISVTGDNNGAVAVTDNVVFPCDSNGDTLTPMHGEYEPYSIVKHNIELNYGVNENFGDKGRVIVAGNLCSTAKWSNLYCHVTGYNAAQYANSGQRIVCHGNIFHAPCYFNDNAYLSTSMVAGVSFLGEFRELLFANNLLIEHKAVPFARPALQINSFHQGGRVAICNNIISDSMCGGITLATEAANTQIHGNYLHNCGGRGIYPIAVSQTGSLASSRTVSAIDTGTNVFTSATHNWVANDDGIGIRFSLGNSSTFFKADGIVVEEAKLFYLKYVDANTFQVSEEPGGAAIDVTSTFSGTLYATELKHIGGHDISGNYILSHYEQLLSVPVPFSSAGIATSPTNRITLENHGLVTGDEIVFDSAGTIFQISSSPVDNGTLYYVSWIDEDTFQIKPDSASAVCDITNAGSGTHSFRISRRDTSYGAISAQVTSSEYSLTIRNNTLISATEYGGAYGPSAIAGIYHYQTGPLVIQGNYIDGFYNGIRGVSSVTARRVDEQSISSNTIRRCVTPIRQIGGQNGLVLVDDDNVIDPGSGDIRVYSSGTDVSIQGSRRRECVVIPVDQYADQELTFSAGVSSIAATSHPYSTGDRVRLTGSPPSPFSAATDYWVTDTGTSTLTLSSTRGGSALTCGGTGGSATAVHTLPSFGTYVVGDVLINKSWADTNDWESQCCTTAGAVGTAVFAKRYCNKFGDTMDTLTPNVTTADVTGRTFLRTANSSSTTFTGFTNGQAGQIVTVFVNDANTTFAHNGAVGSELPLMLCKGSNYAASSGDVVMFAYDGGSYWREIKQTV